MRSRNCFSFCLIGLLGAVALGAQFRGFQAVTAAPPAPVTAKAGESFEIPLTVRIRSGYHINSDQPLENYLIPTQLAWDAPGFTTVGTRFPEAELVQYEFSDGPMSVFSGEIRIVTTIKAPKTLDGPATLQGKLRYQACNDKSCLAPTSVDVEAVVRP